MTKIMSFVTVGARARLDAGRAAALRVEFTISDEHLASQ
jgi:hypothetical protein